MAVRRGQRRDPDPNRLPAEYVPRTEHEESRRSVREWLRDRDEDDVPDWDDAELSY